MRLAIHCTTWGLVGPAARFPDAVAALDAMRVAGFDGVEQAVPFVGDAAAFTAAAAERGLSVVAGILTEGRSVDDHVDSFRTQLGVARRMGAAVAVSHTGRDAFGDDDAARLFREVLAIGADAPFEIAHETHRGRVLYDPWRTLRLLDRFPALRLNVDYSHWVLVCERLLDDEFDDVLEATAARAVHVHARVGHEEGPQVADPRDPAVAGHLEAHLGWWARVWRHQAATGRTVSTITPEFGPPPYLPTAPFTGAPLADQWDVCRWMAGCLRNRFGDLLP